MVKASVVYKELTEVLREAGIPDAGFEVDLMFLELTGCHRFELDVITEKNAKKMRYFAKKRTQHYPLQYLFGSWPFMDMSLFVGPGVLIPRPETEEVCLVALETVKEIESPRVLDLCAGSGALALGIQSRKPAAKVTAVEYSPEAYAYLVRNCAEQARRFGRAPRPLLADAFAYYRECKPAAWDLIVCNPPYVTGEEYETLAPELYYEPKEALVAEKDGLLFYEAIAKEYAATLKNGGYLVFEIGARQGQSVCEILQHGGYMSIDIRQDVSGHDRMAVCRKA